MIRKLQKQLILRVLLCKISLTPKIVTVGLTILNLELGFFSFDSFVFKEHVHKLFAVYV